jgi:hypothetical protein
VDGFETPFRGGDRLKINTPNTRTPEPFELMWTRVNGRLVSVVVPESRCYVCGIGMEDANHLECVSLQVYSLEQLCLECNKVIEDAADHLKCLEETTEVPWVDWRS